MQEEHISPKDIGEMAAKAGVKMIVMTHFGPSVRPDDDYQRYADEAKKYFSGQVMVAKDLMEF
jgi:ribonuclease BN (tRNA processing enzyme)